MAGKNISNISAKKIYLKSEIGQKCKVTCGRTRSNGKIMAASLFKYSVRSWKYEMAFFRQVTATSPVKLALSVEPARS